MTLVHESSPAHGPPPPAVPDAVEIETVDPAPEAGSSRIPRWVVKVGSPVVLVVVWQILGSAGVLERDVLAPRWTSWARRPRWRRRAACSPRC